MKEYLFVGALLTLFIGGCLKSSLKEPTLWSKTILEDSDGVVSLSNEYSKWTDENIVGRVPNGTEATIIEIKEERMIDGSDKGYRFMRLKIRLVAEPFTEGWVFSNEAGYPTCDESHKKAGTECL
jgi:hypothetical protein